LLVLFLSAPGPTSIYTLSLHDALPICFLPVHSFCNSPKPLAPQRARNGSRQSSLSWSPLWGFRSDSRCCSCAAITPSLWSSARRSEEHTSELQSHLNLVCRLLLEKKNR